MGRGVAPVGLKSVSTAADDRLDAIVADEPSYALIEMERGALVDMGGDDGCGHVCAESGADRPRIRLDDCHFETTCASRGGDLGADEAHADDDRPPGRGSSCTQPCGVGGPRS